MKRPSMACPAPGKHRGFTLIELMIVVVILGILGAIAYPAYGQYLLRSNRVAAQSHLMELAQAQSQYLADARSYAATVDELGIETPDAVSAKYTIEIDVGEGQPASYTITATPVEGTNQVADGALSIDSTGARTPGEKW